MDTVYEWIGKYPSEYSHAIGLDGKRKKSIQEKEARWVSEKLYKEDLYRKNNQAYTNDIRSCIVERSGLAIVLGAGVSVEQGAKSWDALLKDFQIEIEERSLLDDAKTVFQEVGGSSLATAQLCKGYMVRRKDVCMEGTCKPIWKAETA